MKKIISLILLFALLLSTAALTACTITPEGGGGSTPPAGEEGGSDGSAEEGDTEGADGGEAEDGTLTLEKIDTALEEALLKVDLMLATISKNKFPDHNSQNGIYPETSNKKGWNEGFYTGILWHAYELTQKNKYKDRVIVQLPTYITRIEQKLGVDTHDMGFLYTPSCVAAYKLIGNEEAKEAALGAADQLISRYHETGKFIQAWGEMGSNHRLIVDCLMNIPLLYWASDVTGDAKYQTVAINHFTTTLNTCFRADGSTYHTYFFDPETGDPLYGRTHQGVSHESTWARGQAWAMYGSIITYSYEENAEALAAFKATSEYFINHLPQDFVPYWDFTYTDGSEEPRDSSAAAIAACALLAGIRYMDESDPQREKFYTAAQNIMNSLIEGYTTKGVPDANGLLLHGTYNKNSNMGVDEMTIWGDYFYIEALHRLIDPEWEPYW